MVSSTPMENTPVYDLRFSSVVPGNVTGQDRAHELSNMDLAMKLHYIKALYVFRKEAVEGLTVYDLKAPMFRCLEHFFVAAGRVRRSESGRPFIRCNDSGVRVVEAQCDKTVDEWLETKDFSLHDHLAYSQALGPDLGFSPLVYLQMTWFSCGGMSVGLSLAHVIGDVFSASSFINMWTPMLKGHAPTKSLHVSDNKISKFPSPVSRKPFSLRGVDSVGDHWLHSTNAEMGMHSFTITPKRLHHLASSVEPLNTGAVVSSFEVICALMWKTWSKVRGDMGPNTVTICTKNDSPRGNEFLGNRMVISTVELDYSAAKAEVSELAMQICEKRVVENAAIEETLGKDGENSDFLVYGANLTFVNMEDENVYGMEVKGQNPVFVNYTIGGIGEEGVILVLPCSSEGKEESKRMVTVILTKNKLQQLKSELRDTWDIV